MAYPPNIDALKHKQEKLAQHNSVYRINVASVGYVCSPFLSTS